MSVILICPQCDGGTELRGTMDAWYLTWCPECERLWRFDLRTLLDGADAPQPVPHARRPASPST